MTMNNIKIHFLIQNNSAAVSYHWRLQLLYLGGVRACC
jgi:hypothetical protein